LPKCVFSKLGGVFRRISDICSELLDFNRGACRALFLAQQLRQLRHVSRDPPRLVAGEKLDRRWRIETIICREKAEFCIK
jgi:hypothetical protein